MLEGAALKETPGFTELNDLFVRKFYFYCPSIAAFYVLISHCSNTLDLVFSSAFSFLENLNGLGLSNFVLAAQLACYWLSNRTQSPLGLLPKGKTTSWCFQSPRRGLAVLTHGNQKDPCLSKLYIVGFAIIY